MIDWFCRLCQWIRGKIIAEAPAWIDEEDEQRRLEGYRVPFHITDEDQSKANIEKVRRLHGV